MIGKTLFRWTLSVCLCGWGLVRAETGDLNADGRVDVADALRVDEMLAGNIPVEAMADVDGDGAVTETDSWLIHEAVLGTHVPVPLASVVVDSGGGTLSGGGAVLTVPPGAVADTATIALLRDTSGEGLDGGEAEGDVFLFTGLPREAGGLEIRLPLPTTGTPDDWTLTGGEFLRARSADAFAWRWRLLDRAAVTVEGGELVYMLPPLPEEPAAPVRNGEAPPPPVFNMLKIAVAANPADTGTRYFNRIYSSAHFKVYAPDQADDDLIVAIQTLTDKLEVVYNLAKGLGFPLDSHAEWFPLDVYVKNGQREDGLFVDSTFYGKYISIRSGLLATGQLGELKATLAHEFLHFVQSNYGATISTSGWADDATAVWFEKIAVGNPNYVPSVFNIFPAPLSGMHRSVQRELKWTINPREVYNWQDSWNRAQSHGYQMSAFFEYLSRRYDWDTEFIYKFYQKIQSGTHPVQAIDEVLSAATSFDLDRICDFFCADYLQCSHPYLQNHPQIKQPAASSLFSTGKRGTRHVFTKDAENPYEVFEDILTIQELGTVMVQYKLVEPGRFLPKGTILYAEVDVEHCDRLYGIAEHKTGKEFVEGVYDPDEKRYTIEVPVNTESNQVMLHLLVYKAEKIGDGYTESFPVKVTSGLQGRLFIPPFIAFHRINEKSKHEVLANATIDVEAGRLERFAVFDYPLTYADYDYTYSMFNKYATVTRKDDMPLTLKVYGDIRVKTIEPFTVVVKYPSGTSPDGFATFDWNHHDVPAPSGSGSPTLSVMAYHGPQDGVSLTYEPYRIFHEEFAQENLKEVNGGVDVVVPPPIPGYVYMLSVFAKYNTNLQLLYFVSIFPRAEATDE